VREDSSNFLRWSDRPRPHRFRLNQLYSRESGIAHSRMQGGIPRTTGADRLAHHRRADGSDGGRVVGDGDLIELDRVSANLVHVAGTFVRRAATARHILSTRTSFGSFKLNTESGTFELILMSENFRVI